LYATQAGGLDRVDQKDQVTSGGVANCATEPASAEPSQQNTERKQAMIPAGLDHINKILVANGWHDMSPWWQGEIARAYASQKRQHVFRVGRRGGKSQTICRVAVYEALCGEHKIPPGDEGIFGIVSADLQQAKQRVQTVKAILESVGIEGVKYYADSVRIAERSVSIRCYSASMSGVAGYTSIGWMLDEMTRWRDADGNNPAQEVINSLKPTMITMPSAKTWWISSPYATLDVHYDAFEQGNNEHQTVHSAPTWVANPTLSEDDTRAIEPDESVWSREFAAIPMSSEAESFFNATLIDEATVPFDLR
jgi:hypothetical protein